MHIKEHNVDVVIDNSIFPWVAALDTRLSVNIHDQRFQAIGSLYDNLLEQTAGDIPPSRLNMLYNAIVTQTAHHESEIQGEICMEFVLNIANEGSMQLILEVEHNGQDLDITASEFGYPE